MARKYRANKETSEGTYKCIEVTVERDNSKPSLVAHFGGIPLRRKKSAVLYDQNPQQTRWIGYSELLERLLANECELCGSQQNVEVHHIRRLADLKVKGQREKPTWMKVMAARRRKTLIVCKDCHTKIHAGQSTRQRAMA